MCRVFQDDVCAGYQEIRTLQFKDFTFTDKRFDNLDKTIAVDQLKGCTIQLLKRKIVEADRCAVLDGAPPMTGRQQLRMVFDFHKHTKHAASTLAAETIVSLPSTGEANLSQVLHNWKVMTQNAGNHSPLTNAVNSWRRSS